MQNYLDLLKETLLHGELRQDRTGTGTVSLFGRQIRFDLQKGFPLLTTKKLHLRSIIHELLWFLQGETNVRYLHENQVTIWDEWADANGDLGPVYGHQWRHWGKPWQPANENPATPESLASKDSTGIDQVSELIKQIKANPQSRRLIISGWNVSDLAKIPKAPPPCHTLFHFYVHGNKRLSCQLYQRSADLFLGVPFNIASYSLLTMMIAQVCDLEPGDFVHTFGDLHIYSNHLEQTRLLLNREPRPLPTMKLNPRVKSIFDFKFEDFTLEGYDPHPAIKAPVAI